MVSVGVTVLRRDLWRHRRNNWGLNERVTEREATQSSVVCVVWGELKKRSSPELVIFQSFFFLQGELPYAGDLSEYGGLIHPGYRSRGTTIAVALHDELAWVIRLRIQYSGATESPTFSFRRNIKLDTFWTARGMWAHNCLIHLRSEIGPSESPIHPIVSPTVYVVVHLQ